MEGIILYIPYGLGTPWDPNEKLERVPGGKERLKHSAQPAAMRPNPRKEEDDEEEDESGKYKKRKNNFEKKSEYFVL